MARAVDATPSSLSRWTSPGVRRLCGVCLLVGALVLAACAREQTDSSGRQLTEDGYVIEPVDDIGPDAFTPPFTEAVSICDKQKFLTDLLGRQDAVNAWAQVLGMAVNEVPAYVQSLQPKVLGEDTKVINHGLRNGQAYPRNSLLPAGTAVLVDMRYPANLPPGGTPPEVSTPPTPSSEVPPTPPSDVPPSSPPSSQPATSPPPTITTPGGTASTLPGGGLPVTRCKCGNPLLPAGPSGTGTTRVGTTGTASGTTGTAPKRPTVSQPVVTPAPGAGSSVPPTASIVPPTQSQVPPTQSQVPPTASIVPPTQSQVPPTPPIVTPTPPDVSGGGGPD